jgi:hypothetical protein
MVRTLFLIMRLRMYPTAGVPSICLDREEDGGLMNLIPVRLYGVHDSRRRQLAELRGGERACVPMKRGGWALEARSFYAYDPENVDPNACRSRRLVVRVASDAVTVTVSPRFRGSAYLCGWTLERIGTVTDRR